MKEGEKMKEDLYMELYEKVEEMSLEELKKELELCEENYMEHKRNHKKMIARLADREWRVSYHLLGMMFLQMIMAGVVACKILWQM